MFTINRYSGKGTFEEGHAFIGYQKDTPAAVVFQASKHIKRFRKGRNEAFDVLQNSGALGDIHAEELIGERKGSDMWREAVRDTVIIV